MNFWLKWLLISSTVLAYAACNKESYQGTPPIADFSFSESSGLTTDTFKLNVNHTYSGSKANKSYNRWDWEGDGIWDTDYNKTDQVEHRYYSPGNFSTILGIINSNGLTDTISKTIQVVQGYSPPHPHINVIPPVGNFRTEFVLDGSQSFDDEDSLEQIQFRWDLDGNGIWDTRFTSDPTITHVFPGIGTQKVGLQTKDPQGMTASSMKDVVVHNLNPDLIPNFTWTPEFGTTADTFLFDGSSSFYKDNPFASLYYSWKLSPGNEWTEYDACSTIPAHFRFEIEYKIEMRVRDSLQLIAHTQKAITIYHENLPPKAKFEIGCFRGNVRTQFYFDSWATRDFESIPSELEMRWDFDGDGAFDTEYSKEKTIYHQYPESGTYRIVLDVKDPEGLSDTTSQYIIVSPFTNETGLIHDHRDQRWYGTVKIGDQWWMSENLNFSPWDSNKDYVIKRCNARLIFDRINWCDIVGGLYNIYHATRNDFYNDVEGICPAGWHMPAKKEWDILIEHIGGLHQAKKLKVGGDTDFNALYGGYVKPSKYGGRETFGLGEIGYFWSFMRMRGWPIAQNVWNVALLKDEDRIYTGFSGMDYYYSVRCVKDED